MRDLTIGQSALLTDLALCLNRYRLFTPGLYVCVHAAVQLEDGLRIIPGIVAQVNRGPLKQCDPDGDVFRGGPNLVLDVFDAGQTEEYTRRRALFQKDAVVEYVAVEDAVRPTLRWNRLIGGRFATIEPDGNGVIKSMALPGLWIHTQALAERDWWRMLGVIERGVTRDGHLAFRQSMREKKLKSPIPFDAS